MERNTCYLNLSVAEAARTVSELVERAGLSSRMVDCHELRQGENLCGMVLLFEKYFLRMGSRLTLTAVLDNLEGRTPALLDGHRRGGNAPAERRQQDSGGGVQRGPAGEAVLLSGRLKAGGKKMEDSYSVSLGLRECGEAIHAAVTDSVTGELVDHYELTHRAAAPVWWRSMRSTTTGRATGSPSPWFWTTLPAEPASTVSAAAGARGCSASTGGRRSPSRESSTTR